MLTCKHCILTQVFFYTPTHAHTQLHTVKHKCPFTKLAAQRLPSATAFQCHRDPTKLKILYALTSL